MTRFDPAMTLTVDHVVDLDCAPGYVCRGDIDVNTAGWVGFEFGNVHGNELDIMRLDRVFDPRAPGTLMAAPDDFVGWLTAWPAIAVIEPPEAVMLGRRPAIQIDVRATDQVPFGPTGLADPANFGINGGAGTSVRLIVVKVDGHHILIEESLGPENTVHDLDAAIEPLQPLIQSITWA